MRSLVAGPARERRRLVLGLAIAIAAAGSLAGCAGMAAKQAVQEYQQRFDAEVDVSSMDDYVKEWGPPHDTAAVSDGVVGKWRFSYGIRTTASHSTSATVGRSRELYDEIVLTFDKEGILRQYRVWVNR
jgi:hypothetical protein